MTTARGINSSAVWKYIKLSNNTSRTPRPIAKSWNCWKEHSVQQDWEIHPKGFFLSLWLPIITKILSKHICSSALSQPWHVKATGTDLSLDQSFWGQSLITNYHPRVVIWIVPLLNWRLISVWQTLVFQGSVECSTTGWCSPHTSASWESQLWTCLSSGKN